MVLAERNTTDVVRNGRRSRGPSPNTHTGAGGIGGGSTNVSNSVGGNATNAATNEKATTVPGAGTPESSDDDNSTKRNGKTKAKQSEYEEKIRVGRDYQAVCPPLIPEDERRPELMNERALLVWSPTKEIPDMKLEEYISVAKEKYGYNGEQALGMLFWHKHDLERAVMDLSNFTPFPDEWTIEDKVLFEQAFQFHGKSFHRIRQMLPDKSIASLVKYYYSWKKTRHRSSAMDRQEKTTKTAVKEGSENGSEVGSNEESDTDDTKKANNNNSTTNNNNNNASAHSSTSSNNNNNNNNNSNNNNSNSTHNNNSNSNSNSNSNHHSSSSSSGTGGSSGGGGGGNAGDNHIHTNSSSSNNGNSSSSNNGTADMDVVEHLCIYSNTNNDEMLGFSHSGNLDSYNTEMSAAAATINGSGGESSSDGTSTTTAATTTQRRVVVGGFCKNCNVVCYMLFDSPLGRMCKSCHTHWRRTGEQRPISGPECIVTKRSTHNTSLGGAIDRSKRKPPKGMYINHDDLTALAACKNPCEYLAEGDRKIATLMAEIQKNRQLMEHLDKQCDAIVVEDALNAKAAGNAEPVQPRLSARWTQDETQVAILALRDYGKNYALIAKMVGTKTETHVRSFYVNNRRRLNLDQIVKEYETMLASKLEEAAAEEQLDAASAGEALAGADSSTVTSAGKSSGDSSDTNSNNNSSTATNEVQAKSKDEANNKKRLEATAAAKSSGTDSSATASGGITAAAGTATNKSSSKLTVAAASTSTPTATITIVDESDTANSSSSDAANTANTAITSSTSSMASNKSAAATATAAAATNSSLQSERSSEEAANTAKSSNTGILIIGASKRDSSVLQSVEQPPAKKLVLTSSSEFFAK